MFEPVQYVYILSNMFEDMFEPVDFHCVAEVSFT